ncbi:penicillin-binding protein 1A [Shewanella dokdonensis]|uniref:Penicillin-binding protein 1A n=1 Tax=Shewanella dokdonensis TaxID=712036 RepID=A0ABX8DBS7_9GAMM|nr:PBP1A family penicillin-binding protein [Shewanella dokdonensis]MCL1076411.1 PBP1A family penicillin-binding protein [Shewanella dokdonensis]QVK21920.1 PBP1A family penicillin-binding protein [Shewanella dokdonensis]
MKWLKRILIAVFSLALLGIIAIAGAYFYVLPDLPDVATLKTVKLQTPLKIYSSDGKLISQFGEKRRIPLQLNDVPKPLLQAFIATEDSRFYEHNGVDPVGVLRAALVMITTGQKRQGASTITMQVARNFFLTRDKKFIRKIKEIFIALHIEQLLTKDEILELYVNRIYLGQRAYGVGAAAQVYYGKDVQDLTLAEMAVIAGLPKAPSTVNPITSPERAMARRNVVLRRMLDVGYISQNEYQTAAAAPITAKYHGAEIDLYAPYVSEMARDYMVQKYGEEEAYTGGYNVYTTINSDLQQKAQKALRNNVYAYDERHGYRGPVAVLWTNTPPPQNELLETLRKTEPVQELQPAAVVSVEDKQADVLLTNGHTVTIPWQGLNWARSFISDRRQGASPKSAADVVKVGEQIWVRPMADGWQLSQVPQVASAMVSLDPHNGAIRTLVGGFSFTQSQYNRVVQAKRQLGSNIKPFLYATALERGYTLATLINNAPINKPDLSQGIAWRPKNSPDVYGGPTRLRVGLAQSVNVMAVRTLRYIGLDAAVDKLSQFGFDPSDLNRNESLALGSPSVTPLQVVTAFSSFANGGLLLEPYFIDKVEDAYGKTIEHAEPTLACDTPVSTIEPESLAAAPAAATVTTLEQAADNPVPVTNSANNLPYTCDNPQARHAKRVISKQIAFLITDALKSVIWGGGDWNHGTGWNGTAWRAARVIKRHDIAGKTGTTNESRDTWFSGFNPSLVTTAWVGFDDHSRQLGRVAWNPNGAKDQISGAESGAKTAGPAWNEFMHDALEGTPEISITPPPGIVSVRIDLATGKLSRKNDYTSDFEYFIQGTEPKEYANDSTEDGNIFLDSGKSSEELFH